MFKLKLTAFALTAVLVAACGSQPIPDPEPTDTIYGDSGGANTDDFDEGGLREGEILDDLSAGELTNIIYFDFDSSEVRGDFTEVVSRHAMQLQNNSSRQVRLEGHADERGSREYNIGLGERRSQAVRRLLLIQGVSAGQISTVSFGEERPAMRGSDEDAWAQNRRVEIKYTN